MPSAAAPVAAPRPQPVVLALAAPLPGDSGEVRIPSLAMLGGTRLIERLLSTLRTAGLPPALVVAADEAADQVRAVLPSEIRVLRAGGGRREALSAALGATADELLLIHDAERALTPAATIAEVVAGLDAAAEAVVPVIAMTDSVKAPHPDGLRNIDRSTLAGMQSPRLLRRAALEGVLTADDEDADEILAALGAGARVRTVHGSHAGFAIVDRLSLWQAQIALGLARDTSHRHGLARRS